MRTNYRRLEAMIGEAVNVSGNRPADWVNDIYTVIVS